MSIDKPYLLIEGQSKIFCTENRCEHIMHIDRGVREVSDLNNSSKKSTGIDISIEGVGGKHLSTLL